VQITKKILFFLLAAMIVVGLYFIIKPDTSKEVKDNLGNNGEVTKQQFKGEIYKDEYVKIAENNELTLYLNKSNLAIKVMDNQTGYTWSSIIDELVPKENNKSWANFMSSGISIEYFENDKPNPDRTDLISEKKKTVQVIEDENGFTANIYLDKLEIGFQLKIKIENNNLVVNIPNESIIEGSNKKLASIYVYPLLGATRKDEIKGYLFVPDGAGALIRFKDNQNKYSLPYETKIYGLNEAIDKPLNEKTMKEPYNINFPVFGVYHDVKHGQSILGIIENGQYNAKILGYPNGVTTQYNWVTAKFLFRETYLQPTSRSMEGMIISESIKNDEDIQVRYVFKHGEDANYIGMAKTYQKYLVDHGVLKKKEEFTKDIPLRVDFLGAESKNALFFKKVVPMTTVADVKNIVKDLKSNGIEEMLVVYRGWNKGGFSGQNPYGIAFEEELGSKKDFQSLIETFKVSGIPLYFYDNYTLGFDESDRFTAREDAAVRIDKTIFEKKTFRDVYDHYFYLSSEKTKEIMNENISRYEDQKIENIALDGISNVLYSEKVEDQVLSRAAHAEVYTNEIAKVEESLHSVAMYRPNDYMLQFTDSYLEVPMYSSQYIYLDETVPFVQIVLRGYVDYYASYSNFFANQSKETLKLIEYGAFPSYFLTKEQSYKLKYTNSNHLFTSAYSDWKNRILATYEKLNDVLLEVQGASIEDRVILAKDVVKVSYSNNVDIIVNYTNRNYEYQGVTVPAKGFQIVGVK
jgi:hypothetical protein